MEYGQLKRALEGVLFAAGEPVTAQRLCLGLETDRTTLDQAARELAEEYEREKRGVRLLRLEHSYQLCSAPEQAAIIRRTLESRKPPKLSQPALEVLAVVAYFQPVTRAYIDRPVLLRTTKTFLRSFGLSDLDELPTLPDLSKEGEQTTLDLKAAIHRLEEEQELEAGASPGQDP